MNIKRLKTLLAIGAVSIFASTPLMGENLIDAMRWAYEGDELLNSTRAQIRSAREQVIVTNSAIRPQINFSSSLSHSVIDTPNAFTGQTTSTSSSQLGASLSASLLLYDGGQTKHSVDSALAQLRGQLLQLRASEQQLLFDVARVYVDILRNEQLVHLAQNNIRVLETRRDSAQLAFDAGSATRGDLALTEASVAEARAQLTGIVASLDVAKAEYRQMTGRDPGNLAPISDAPALPATLEEAIATSQRISPFVLAALEFERAAQYNLRRAQGINKPTVSLNAQAQATNALDGTGPRDGVSVGVNLNVPIYTGGRNSALIRQAESALESQIWQTDDTRSSLRQQVAESWANLENAKGALRASMEAVEAQRIADQGANVEFDLGAISVIDRLTIQQDLLAAQSNEITARYNRILSSYAVLLFMGKIGEDILGNEIPEIDPLKTPAASTAASQEREAIDQISDRWSR